MVDPIDSVGGADRGGGVSPCACGEPVEALFCLGMEGRFWGFTIAHHVEDIAVFLACSGRIDRIGATARWGPEARVAESIVVTEFMDVERGI